MKEIGQDLSGFNCGLAHFFCKLNLVCGLNFPSFLFTWVKINIRFPVYFAIVQHTSASLTINENYDPDVREDTETFLNSVVPEVCLKLYTVFYMYVTTLWAKIIDCSFSGEICTMETYPGRLVQNFF